MSRTQDQEISGRNPREQRQREISMEQDAAIEYAIEHVFKDQDE